MSHKISKAERVIVVFILMVAAIAYPLPLYITSLAIFGLPHVIWEVSWVKQLYGKQVSPLCWKLAGTVLALQAIARFGGWLSMLDHMLVEWIDIITLALLLMVAASSMYYNGKTHANYMLVLLVLAVGEALINATWQQMVVILAVLSIAHNFTPVVFINSIPGESARTLKKQMYLLFCMPALMYAALWAVAQLHLPLPILEVNAYAPQEALWLTKQYPNVLHATLSSLVLAQCLHYYAVIRVIPAGLGKSFSLFTGLIAAILLSSLLLLMFNHQFASAKNLYAIAAGAHAWLEWFIIAVLASHALPQRRNAVSQ